jgi:hypothetical protein
VRVEHCGRGRALAFRGRWLGRALETHRSCCALLTYRLRVSHAADRVAPRGCRCRARGCAKWDERCLMRQSFPHGKVSWQTRSCCR